VLLIIDLFLLFIKKSAAFLFLSLPFATPFQKASDVVQTKDLFLTEEDLVPHR
jgi:hypothetical protein